MSVEIDYFRNNETRKGSWESLRAWTRLIRDFLTPQDQEALRYLLSVELEWGLPGENGLILTSSAPLRHQVLGWLVPCNKVQVFNSHQIELILNWLPRLSQALAESLGWQDGIDGLIPLLFDEVTHLGWLLPNQPNRDHLWSRLGILRLDQNHPLMMAMIKAWSASFFMDLADWPASKRPHILSIDTVNRVWLSPDIVSYYGLPPELIKFLEQTNGEICLDRFTRMKGALSMKGGVVESDYYDLFTFLAGIAQLRVRAGHVFGVGNKVLMTQGGYFCSAGGLDIFGAVYGMDVDTDPSVPGGLRLGIGEKGTPFDHRGSWINTLGRYEEREPLGRLSEAYHDSGRYPMLAQLMTGVRGFPIGPVAGLLEVFGYRVNRSYCLGQLERYPGLWTQPFPDVAGVINGVGS